MEIQELLTKWEEVLNEGNEIRNYNGKRFI